MSTPVTSPRLSLWQEMLALARLGAPLIVAQLAWLGLVFVDTVMAGRLGQTTLAGVGVGGSLWSTVILLGFGILMAVSSFVADFDGAGDRAAIAPFVHQAFHVTTWLALITVVGVELAVGVLQLADIDAAVLPEAKSYLYAVAWAAPGLMAFMLARMVADGLSDTRPVMFVAIGGLLLNIPLDYILMFGKFGLPALGAAGCGYATAIVLTVEAIVLHVWLSQRRSTRGLNLYRQPAPPDAATIRSLLLVGIPIGITLFFESTLFAAAAVLMAKLGALQAAAHQVAINVAALAFMLPLGLALAITIRVGNAVGRGDAALARRRGTAGLLLVLLTQTVSALVLVAIPGTIAAVYTTDQAVAGLVVQLLVLAAIFQYPDGIQVLMAGALRGLKDTKIPMAITLTAYWVFGLGLSYLWGLRGNGGAQGIWWGLIVGLSVAAVALLLRFYGALRGNEVRLHRASNPTNRAV